MTPRVILMTDGKPTDAAGEEEVLLKINRLFPCFYKQV